MPPRSPSSQKTKLLDAAVHVIRAQGYADATVDDVCQQAGVTKGSFFHHFKSKEDMALTAINHWNISTESFFAQAPYHQPPDPLDRLLGYLDLRSELIQESPSDFTCLLGTLVQETYCTHPRIRDACDSGMRAHIALLVQDVEAAKALHCSEARWTAESVGNFIQAVLQGSFVLAKASGNPELIKESLDHLKCYLRSLYSKPIAGEPHEQPQP